MHEKVSNLSLDVFFIIFGRFRLDVANTMLLMYLRYFVVVEPA